MFKPSDLRLESFARFLSEEWDFSTFLDFLTAQAALLQPALRGTVVAIEWPAKEEKGELYSWVDTSKAINVADAVLGARAAVARDKFNDFIKSASSQVGVPRPRTGNGVRTFKLLLPILCRRHHAAHLPS